MKDTISFYSLGLSQRVIESINEMGFEEPTPIQEQTIPLALEGCDLIGQAHTGTGKTAAFGIPMVERFQERSDVIQGLVVTPTRELAVQVAEELNKIGQFKGVRALPIYGGQDINRQLRALSKRPNIIVGTPGRLLDHIRRKTVRLNAVQMVVLDEADEMLNMGFIDDVRAILREIPHEHQTLLFSATMPLEILELSHQFMQAPELITIIAKEMTVESTEQYYMEVQERQKVEVLCRLLDLESPDLAIVFVRTKRRVDELAGALAKRGYSAEGIHGDLTQSRRDTVMHHFREGSIDILVATDVAARGLDITGVTHVYNFDIPQDPEGYVHRIGRTGRVGKAGEALTFVTPWETDQLKAIEKMTRRKMVRKPVPSMTEAMVGQQRLTVDKLMQVVAEGELQQYKRLAEELLDENDSVTLLSAALKMLTREPDTTPIQLSQESPSRGNRPRGFNPQYRPKNRGPRRDGGAVRRDNKSGEFSGKKSRG